MLPKYIRKCTCGGTPTLYESQGFAWESIRYYYSCDICDKETRKCEDKVEAEQEWNKLNSKADFDYRPNPCPFCRGKVSIVVCDDEGNMHNEEYEKKPWSGLGYQLKHDVVDVPTHVKCPIATHEGETIGMWIYNSRKEAADAWNAHI